MPPRNSQLEGASATVVAIATTWGYANGGLNSLNTDLLRALSRVAPDVNIVCVVPSAPKINSDVGANLKLVEIPGLDPSAPSDDLLEIVLQELRTRPGFPASCVWLGHDIITGPATLRLRALASGGSLAVVQHTSYSDYSALKHLDPLHATEKHRLQKQIFAAADVAFAVGPLLTSRLKDVIPSAARIHTLIPGLSILESTHATSRLCAMSFGRLDIENDRIKQGRLVAAAFASAISHARSTPGLDLPIFENPTLKLLGLDDNPEIRNAVLRSVERQAHRALDVRLLPYLDDRQLLLREFDGVNLSLFLSWHDGFGLSAWEAIGMGIPLILSEATGVYKLLEQIGGIATGCVTSVDIRGSYGLESDQNFHRDDVRAVRDAILSIGTKLQAKLTDADNLRRLLYQQKGFTWEAAARGFADTLGLPTATNSAPALALSTETALRVDKMINDFDLETFHRTLSVASTLLDTGRYESALTEIKAIAMDDAPLSATAELNVLRSEIHLRLNEYEAAQEYATKAIEYFKDGSKWSLLLDAKGVLNTMHRDQGRYGIAVEIANEMLTISRDHCPSDLGSTHRKLARSLALNRQWRNAVTEAEAAIKLAEQSQNLGEQAKAHLACGEAHRHGFVQSSAIEEYKTAIDLASIRGDWDCFLWSALGLADSYSLLDLRGEARDVLNRVKRLLNQPGRRFPLESLHYRLSVAVLDVVEGKVDQQILDGIVAEYAQLSVDWPREYIAEILNIRKAVEPKRI